MNGENKEALLIDFIMRESNINLFLFAAIVQFIALVFKYIFTI